MFTQIIAQTPPYVWGVFAYLLFTGWSATKTRTLWVPKLFLVSFILTLSKLPKIITMSYTYTLSPWLLGLILGTVSGVSHQHVEFLVEKNAIRLPGSYITLVMFTILFSVKYSLGFLQTTHPDIYTTYGYLDTVITFLFSGYSFSKATAYTIRFLKYRHRKKKLNSF